MSLLNKSCQGNLLETVLLQTHNFSPKKKKFVSILTHSPQLDPPKHQKAMHLVKKPVFKSVSIDLFIKKLIRFFKKVVRDATRGQYKL